MGRIELDNQQRKEILNYYVEQTSGSENTLTNRALSAWASQKFGSPISEMTISRLLRKKDHYLSVTSAATKKRVRNAKCPEVEIMTFTWFRLMQERGGIVSDALICEAAKRFYENTVPGDGKSKLTFSHGWVNGFKKRHGIRGYSRHGESTAADPLEESERLMAEVREKVSKLDPADVFNMDETGLFFRVDPVRTLATEKISAENEHKERITVALTSNADGSMKLPPFVIYSAWRPRAFSHWNISCPENLGILWASNERAWMTPKTFEQFLLDFERRMKIAGKEKVILLLDNYPGHKVVDVADQLQITSVIMLPPNMTSKSQPMDAGIISTFKAHYRKELVEHKTACLMANRQPQIDICEAVLMIEKAWRIHVTSTTIRHCWRQTGFFTHRDLSMDFEDAMVESSNTEGGEVDPLLREQLDSLLSNLGRLSGCVLPTMNASEYINFEAAYDSNNSYKLQDEDVLHMVLPGETVKDEAEEEDISHEPLPLVSYLELKTALETIRRYIQQRPQDCSILLTKLASLEHDIELSRSGNYSG